MNVLIIEDEKIAANNLEKMLHQIDENIHVQDKIDSIKSAVKWLGTNKTDLIFLDIHLADGISFKIFEHVKIQPPIIFTTAYDQYAIKAFKVNSIDYLLKPIEIRELEQSLNKFKELIRMKNTGTIDYNSLIDLLSNKTEYQQRFIVRYGQKVKSIKITSIAYFNVIDENVFLCTKDNKNYPIDYSLDKLENILAPKEFFRINRQFIVSYDAIENMFFLSKSRIKIILKQKPDKETIVSYSRLSDFKKWLNQ